jgi:hypothetical protein
MYIQAKSHILTADPVKWEHEKSFLFMYIQAKSHFFSAPAVILVE